MKIFNMIEIKKVEKEIKPMTTEEADLAVLGVCPDDTEPEPKKAPKKKFVWTKKRKRVAIGAGIAAAVGTTALGLAKALGGDDEVLDDDDPDDDEAEEIDEVVDEVAGNLIG